MAHIDNLVERIPDAALREQIASEVAKLVERTEFGLVFQRHLPEDLEVPGVTPRRGDIVRVRADEAKQNHLVLSVKDHQTSLIAVDASKRAAEGATAVDYPLVDLVVVKDFDAPIYPGLKPIKAIERGGTAPAHVVLEGENYYALETLLYTHERKVDVIYIDPPYNTGANSWIYNDRFVNDDGYRHSKWLSFVERRLKHAKRLLKPTGFILISIDDTEQHRLRMLLDAVFGEQNFVATFVWNAEGNVDNQAEIKINHEYVLMYAADETSLVVTGVQDPNVPEDSKLNNDTIRNSVVKNGPKNPKSTITLPQGFPASFKSGIVETAEGYWPQYSDDPVVEDGALLNKVDAYTGWANGKLLRRFIDLDFTPVLDTKKQLTKFELSASGAIENVKVRREGQHHILTVLFNLGTTERAGNVLKSLGVTFPYPKPVELIAYLLSLGPSDGVFLDFFGGSGTTTEAAMTLNARDGGTRQSILVTNNELSSATAARLREAGHLPGDDEWEAEGVFEKVARPRIEAVATGLLADKTKHSEGFDANVAFYKLTYEDENLMALDRRFNAIAPLLWLKAGGTGATVLQEAGAGWSLPTDAVYGVLFDLSEAKEFGAAVAEHELPLRQLFIVSDSGSAFQVAVGYLPTENRLSASRLYSDYLHSFEINGKD